MSQSFKGLVSTPRSVWLDVTIARLRPKQIFIMGEVNTPGSYSVSTYANVFNSLFWAGGPTMKGSLRDIRLIRNNKAIAHVDLYKYLAGAEKINDVRVQSNDIIFVPTRGKTVSVSGEIRRPGIYELLPDENLKRLLEFAGGALPTTYLERVQIESYRPLPEPYPGRSRIGRSSISTFGAFLTRTKIMFLLMAMLLLCFLSMRRRKTT